MSFAALDIGSADADPAICTVAPSVLGLAQANCPLGPLGAGGHRETVLELIHHFPLVHLAVGGTIVSPGMQTWPDGLSPEQRCEPDS